MRVNPGNYVDKKKFSRSEYTDAEYAEEIERIRNGSPPVRICKEHGTAMRIGTNHGSLSDRIMSRYGDTAIGMVESAMEFLRVYPLGRLSQHHPQHEEQQPAGDGADLPAAHQTHGRGIWRMLPLHLGVTEAGTVKTEGSNRRLVSVPCSKTGSGIPSA